MTNMRYSSFKEANELCTALLNTVEARDRIKAKHIFMQDLNLEKSPATEGTSDIVRGAGRSALVEALYKDIIAKGNVDFGKIPQSKGNLTSCVYYKNMQTTMDNLNKLIGSNANEDMVRMNDLHAALISDRDLFEFGFKANDEFIQYAYCTLVEALIDIIDANIVMYVNYLKETQNIELPQMYVRSSTGGDSLNARLVPVRTEAYRRVCKAVDTFLSLRAKGEWRRYVDSVKRNYAKHISGFVVVGLATLAIVSVAALFHCIRMLIYTYYYTAVKVDEKARAMAMYIESASAIETDATALQKQQKISKKLNNLAIWIETKILADDPKTEAAIQKSDAAISKAALKNANSSSNNSQIEYDFSF